MLQQNDPELDFYGLIFWLSKVIPSPSPFLLLNTKEEKKNDNRQFNSLCSIGLLVKYGLI
jgi:hypothetical protein